MGFESWSSSKKRGTGEEQPNPQQHGQGTPYLLALTLTLLNVPSPDSEKSSRAASSLLANLWQYSKLHRDFRAVCLTEPGNRVLGHGVQCKLVGHQGRDTSLECREKGPRLYPEHYGEGRISGTAKAVLISLSPVPCRRAIGRRTSWAHR